MRFRRDLYFRRYLIVGIITFVLAVGAAVGGYFTYKYVKSLDEKGAYSSYNDACDLEEFHLFNPLYLLFLDKAKDDKVDIDYLFVFGQLNEIEYVKTKLSNQRNKMDDWLNILEKQTEAPVALKDIHQPLIENIKTGQQFIDGVIAAINHQPNDVSDTATIQRHLKFQEALKHAELYLDQLEALATAIETLSEADQAKLSNCDSGLTKAEMQNYIDRYRPAVVEKPELENVIGDEADNADRGIIKPEAGTDEAGSNQNQPEAGSQ